MCSCGSCVSYYIWPSTLVILFIVYLFHTYFLPRHYLAKCRWNIQPKVVLALIIHLHAIIAHAFQNRIKYYVYANIVSKYLYFVRRYCSQIQNDQLLVVENIRCSCRFTVELSAILKLKQARGLAKLYIQLLCISSTCCT